MRARSPGIGSGIFVLLALTAVACGMTLLFLGMRSVMEIGGACASGGPFVPVRPCPEGTALTIVGGFWLGAIAAGIYIWQAFKSGIPSLAGFLWPALFLSLGWNFFEFGLSPPGKEGLEWGWIVCGVIFALMGGLPLLLVVPALVGAVRGDAPDAGPRAGSPLRMVQDARRARAGSGKRDLKDLLIGISDDGDDVVVKLERLDKLYRSGGLTLQEYSAAKARVLGETS